MAETAVERIVVQATPKEKKLITAKAKKLGMAVSELMRRGASAYTIDEDNAALGMLADSAKAAADRSCAAIDDMLAFVAASNKRIEASNKRMAEMEAKAALDRKANEAAIKEKERQVA